MNVAAIILAAGKGSRMETDLPKPIVLLKGKPLVEYIINAFREAGINDIHLIVGYKGNEVIDQIGHKVNYVWQKEQKGTAHAVLQAKDLIKYQGKDVFVFVGDSPLIRAESIIQLYNFHKQNHSACTFLTSHFDMQLPYARIIRDGKGDFVKCVEEKDATNEELLIKELLSSHFIFNGEILFELITQIKEDPQKGEFYLTDIIDLLRERNLPVKTLQIDSYQELVGLNTPEDLSWAENLLS